jgi:hypothetical protein
MKAQAVKDVPSGHGAKPIPGQKTIPLEDDPDGSALQQVTIKVSAQAVAVIQAFSDQHGIKRNRLFDEAVQAYAAMLEAGLRWAKIAG